MGHLKSILTMSTSILQRDEALPPDEDIGPASVATAAVLTALMIITTSARIWVRAANRKLGWDDWTILVASGVSIVRFAFVVKQQQYGNGRHRVYLSEYDYMMINIATGFGIARAASLGITTTDLSWAYCIAGIWSNLELFLGIIAANLALSRSIWVHFFGSNDSHAIPGSTGRSNPTESGYVNSKLRGDQFEVPSTMPGIQKKTEFWWTEDDESQSQTPLKR
ncbi:hypothetical protein Brms1b_010151 [Colletotrichum noveboracense]|nr:hypothetical protein Brms1b_010151 [Colletotrichum noveboracense]